MFLFENYVLLMFEYIGFLKKSLKKKKLPQYSYICFYFIKKVDDPEILSFQREIRVVSLKTMIICLISHVFRIIIL